METEIMEVERNVRRYLAVATFMLLGASRVEAQRTEANVEVTDAGMGAAAFELYAKVGCGEGRPDAVDYALSRALRGADLLPDRAVGMRRGIREAHAALVAKGGCRSFPAEDLARIRANGDNRARAVLAAGGEMELRFPETLGGEVAGTATYATVAVDGTPFSALCLQAQGGTSAGTLLILSPSDALLKEGNHDLAQLRAVARLRVPRAGNNVDLRYAMIGISEPEGAIVRGSVTGFLRSGEMFSATFSAVPAEDPCGVKGELAS
jgi:hypothetical protein